MSLISRRLGVNRQSEEFKYEEKTKDFGNWKHDDESWN